MKRVIILFVLVFATFVTAQYDYQYWIPEKAFQMYQFEGNVNPKLQFVGAYGPVENQINWQIATRMEDNQPVLGLNSIADTCIIMMSDQPLLMEGMSGKTVTDVVAAQQGITEYCEGKLPSDIKDEYYLSQALKPGWKENPFISVGKYEMLLFDWQFEGGNVDVLFSVHVFDPETNPQTVYDYIERQGLACNYKESGSNYVKMICTLLVLDDPTSEGEWIDATITIESDGLKVDLIFPDKQYTWYYN